MAEVARTIYFYSVPIFWLEYFLHLYLRIRNFKMWIQHHIECLQNHCYVHNLISMSDVCSEYSCLYGDITIMEYNIFATLIVFSSFIILFSKLFDSVLENLTVHRTRRAFINEFVSVGLLCFQSQTFLLYKKSKTNNINVCVRCQIESN